MRKAQRSGVGGRALTILMSPRLSWITSPPSTPVLYTRRAAPRRLRDNP